MALFKNPKKSNKPKLAATAPPMKGQEYQYYRKLKELVNTLTEKVNENVLSLLKAREHEYVIDQIGLEVVGEIQQIGRQMELLNVEAIPSRTVRETATQNKKRFEKNISRAVGVDITGILAEEGLQEFLEMQIAKNVTLIKNMSAEYLKNVETIITNGISQGLRHEEIAKQIRGMNGANSVLNNKAKLIARNEIANINSQLNKKRSENLGFKKFVWRTAQDERVRGNPAGRYPKAKPSHYKLNGQTFEWAKGAKTEEGRIWPGSQINCRCVAVNVIE